MPGYDFELILSRPLLEVELDPLFQRTHGLVTVAVVSDLDAGRPGQAGCLWEAPTLSAAIMEMVEHLEASAPVPQVAPAPEEITSALSAIIPHVA